MLTPAQHRLRANMISASFWSPLCANKEDIIIDKWKELVGDPTWKPRDLSNVWEVYLGNLLETPALDWHERKTQHEITRRGEVVIHPAAPNICATLDGYRAFDDTVIDCKVTNHTSDLDALLRYHAPQLLCQMECTGAAYASLLIVHGGAEPQELQAHFTEEWKRQVWAAVDAFRHCVETLTPPVALPPVPPAPEKWSRIDLDADSDRYNWAAEMIAQLDIGARTAQAAEENAAAKVAIKELLPFDCGEVRHAGRVIKRARNRAVTIRFNP